MTSMLATGEQPRSPAAPLNLLQDSFPNSTKVYVEGSRGITVPMREIALSGGEPPLRVYDTSGPQDVDVREGLPGVRSTWIGKRDVVEGLGARAPLRGRGAVTQLHFAR